MGGNLDRIFFPALDGLRFFAFLAVFMLHSLPLAQRGWLGVELFFAISAFLFFRLMQVEWDRTGSVDVGRFYLRRLLRLYPLMALFPIAMLIIFGMPPHGLQRLIGILTFRDNLLACLHGFNPVPFSPQLWTLSAEFQLYLIIPFLFIASRKLGDRHFLVLAAALGIAGIVARYLVISAGAPHPVVWVLPALHPESTLLGMVAALAISSRLEWRAVLIVAVVAALVLAIVPIDYMRANGRMWIYPVAGIMCAAFVWLAAHRDFALLRNPAISYLGKISFGLYVFHILGLHIGDVAFPESLALKFASGLALTVALAAISYEVLERPLLRLKSRFEIVPSRPV